MTRSFFLFLGGLLAGIMGMAFLKPYLPATSAHSSILREKTTDYHFISPLIACELGDKKDFEEFRSLEDKIQRAVQEYKVDGKAKSLSVYFRDLEPGRWTGVNEDEQYSPASLYKVVLMLAYLKKAESNLALLDETIVWDRTPSEPPLDYAPLEQGRSYTVRELINRLIIESNNDAKDALHDHISLAYVNDIFSDLGLEAPSSEDTGDSMSAKSYSRFFRTLYSSTYLTRPMSELALQILSKTTFIDGVVKGLPSNSNLVVAHKYGYRVFDPPVNGVSKELHDCGIIYYPQNPYFLCVMTKGWNNNDLKSVIQKISRIVYNEVAIQSKVNN